MSVDAPKCPLRSAETESSGRTTPPGGPTIPHIRSKDLFGSSREIVIEHEGSWYRLRVTYSNKLILTK
ncbi:MAG: hemin uptake protein HemP [Proteobacteria bacterium]|nr:MAG: hemin uptake protein HemP [Pseudomonadota bacterium]